MKSRSTAVMLSILLGGLGVHKFYLGQPGLGVLYALFCWTFIPMILGVIEGVMFLGMNDAKFNELYNGVGVSASVPGAMRKCPECAELVKAEAVRCRYCQSRLEPVEYAAPVPAVAVISDPQTIRMVVAVISILAIVAFMAARR